MLQKDAHSTEFSKGIYVKQEVSRAAPRTIKTEIGRQVWGYVPETTILVESKAQNCLWTSVRNTYIPFGPTWQN
jgi:hypothetical protein